MSNIFDKDYCRAFAPLVAAKRPEIIESIHEARVGGDIAPPFAYLAVLAVIETMLISQSVQPLTDKVSAQTDLITEKLKEPHKVEVSHVITTTEEVTMEDFLRETNKNPNN